MKKNYKMKMAGHEFDLAYVRFGIHSEETCDYMAVLVCDGQYIGEVENDGHGGATFFRAFNEFVEVAREVEAEVRKVVWLVCKDGTKIFHDFGTVADEILYAKYA